MVKSLNCPFVLLTSILFFWQRLPLVECAGFVYSFCVQWFLSTLGKHGKHWVQSSAMLGGGIYILCSCMKHRRCSHSRWDRRKLPTFTFFARAFPLSDCSSLPIFYPSWVFSSENITFSKKLRILWQHSNWCAATWLVRIAPRSIVQGPLSVNFGIKEFMLTRTSITLLKSRSDTCGWISWGSK